MSEIIYNCNIFHIISFTKWYKNIISSNDYKNIISSKCLHHLNVVNSENGKK